ncbi:hypothetical protein HG536_0E05340 [Torulaspora globosa]|uniref:NAD(+) diphosphatase n=1 Tax=Torulaspora globosa TaxID=48254 RepID=A0A7G3ZJD7_9SACH|nr:uncharacterized protein HG536_0E05340 [Torulaspora globosa]QLL33623.1 hypothetical protein HG536_0E05340 [Torulaspora globosa]
MEAVVRTGATFFGYESLNRVSFLRNDVEFVRKSLQHKSTVFVPFVQGEALVRGQEEPELCLLTLQDGWFPMARVVDKLLPVLNSQAARVVESGANLTFLGLKSSDGDDVFQYRSSYSGVPYYAVDFRTSGGTLIQAAELEPLLQCARVDRKLIFEMSNETASLYSHAKMYLDWLAKYHFCPGCGSVMFPVDAGTKMQCGNADRSVACNVRDAAVNNVCFPRTDPVVIVAIATKDFSRICLAHSKRWVHDTLYSTVAGFMEPAETVEQACSREIWEETGIRCRDITLVSTQPWPYPANLMIGCVGLVEPNGVDEKINLSHDNELMDAQWFDVEEVIEAMDRYDGSGVVKFKKSDITFPGSTAIAFHLIKFVCDRYKRSLGSL